MRRHFEVIGPVICALGLFANIGGFLITFVTGDLRASLLVWIGFMMIIAGWVMSSNASNSRCPHCFDLVKGKALKCPYCGTVLAAPSTTRADEPFSE